MPGSTSPTWGLYQPAEGVYGISLDPGTQFGPRYRIEALLGEGGMGKVYRAQDAELGRTVALKLVRPEFASDPRSMQRFKQELLLQSKISHKNILRIHDLGDVAGVKFISMALVEGEDLHDIIENHGKLPLERALKLFRQLCQALEAAHNEEVAHRDLKPRNILVDRADHVYVSDFGLAKSLEAEATMMTRTGQILGTPMYMSPEQVEGKPVDRRSDLYSLGLIFYEMVTGEVPFTGDSTLQLMYQRVNEKPKSPKTIDPSLPDNVVRVIMRCLEKEPNRRYQSATEILQELEVARTPSHSLIIQIPTPARPAWWLLGVGLVLLIGLGVAIAPLRRMLEKSPRATAQPAAAQERYLAVLPFRVQGDAPALKYEAAGVVEALAAKLFQLKSVHLASPADVEKVDLKAPLDKIARTLGVGLLVQGTVQSSGDKIAIIARLDDVKSRRRLWEEQFSGQREDLLTLEDQIYGKLVGALELKLSNEERARGASRPTERIDAYDLYLRGRNTLRGQRDPESVNQAIKLYEQATRDDPSFALAYAGLTDAYLLMYDFRKDGLWAEKALGAANQGQRLNDNLPEIHFSLGSLYMKTGKTAGAVAELRHALELAPNSDEGYRRLGSAYMADGRKDEALRAYQKAIEVNPYYWQNYNQLGAAYLQLGKNKEAMQAFRRVTELEPDRALGYANMGVVYYREGRWQDCVPAFQKAIELQPTFRSYSNLGVAHFYLGQYAEAAKMFEKAVAMSPNEQLAVGNLADAYRWLGQKDKALATYDRAIAVALQAVEVNPRDASTLGSLALYYAKKGDLSRARTFLRRARSIDPNDTTLIYKEVVLDALASQPAEAFGALRQALEKGYPLEEAKNDPELKSLQGNAEFTKLAKEFSRPTN